MDALQLEQLVKRWTLVYVISPQKKLNKSVRLNLKNEKDRVCLFIEERLDLKDIILPLQLSSSAYGLCEFASVQEYQKNRSGFHYCCFILGLMQALINNPNYGSRFELKNVSLPYQEIDLRMFLEKIPWEKVRNNMKIYFKNFEVFMDKKRDTKHASSYFDGQELIINDQISFLENSVHLEESNINYQTELGFDQQYYYGNT